MARLWHPAATRDPDPSEPGQTLGSGDPKIVLMTAETVKTAEITGPTVHFTFDTRPSGRLFQHIPLDVGGYALDEGSGNNPNTAGKVIQVRLYGHAAYAQDWSAEQLRRLGILLSWICNAAGVRKLFPRTFRGPNSLDPRMSWGAFQNMNGIVGRQHVPYQSEGDPGRLDSVLLRSLMGPEGGSPGGSIFIDNPVDEDVRTDASGNIREGDAGESDVEESTPYVADVDISSKPFRFNPPLHRDNLPVRVDYGSVRSANRTLDAYKDETDLGRNWTEEQAGKLGKRFQEFRLGRIIQDRTAVGYAAEGEYRHGFRFLYNPTQITVAASRNNSVILDGRSAFNLVLSGINQNYQVITLPLILNRIPDVMEPRSGDRDNDYTPRLYPGDRKKIRKFGTHYDLEFLYRICNGTPKTVDRGKTGDIGVIIPANARLILGKGQNFFGFIESVSYEDVMFSADMVPIKTTVNLVFRRHVDIKAQSTEAWISRFSSVATSDIGGLGGGDDGTDNAGVPDSFGTGSQTLVSDPTSSGRIRSVTRHMYEEVMEQYGDIFVSNGCWRSNGYGSPAHPDGHACDFGLGPNWANADLQAKATRAAHWMRANHRRLGIQYIIWDQRIWNKSRDSEGWRLSSRYQTGNPSQDHRNHIHVSCIGVADG